MAFSLNTRRVGDVIVLEMSGRLVEGEPAALLRNTIRHRIAAGDRRFILDLGGVSFINTAGLTAFTAIRSWMDECGGKTCLLHPTKRVRQLLAITHLVSVFDTFDDEKAAVRSLTAIGAAG